MANKETRISQPSSAESSGSGVLGAFGVRDKWRIKQSGRRLFDWFDNVQMGGGAAVGIPAYLVGAYGAATIAGAFFLNGLAGRAFINPVLFGNKNPQPAKA